MLQVAERPEHVPDQFGNLTYLQAERLGPRDLLTVESTHQDETNVGVRGEYVAHVLSRQDRNKASPSRSHPRHPDLVSIPKQVEAWLQDLVPGIEIVAAPLPGVTANTIRLKKSGEWLRPQNIGFGISYVLPIIVAGLVAKEGSLLVIENPEAHLHPQGQSMLAAFLGRIAASGVQVLVETHSDHFLNGLRLAVVQAGHPLQASQVGIAHFTSEAAEVKVEQIGITNRGALTSAPRGFFDQSEKDMADILKARHS